MGGLRHGEHGIGLAWVTGWDTEIWVPDMDKLYLLFNRYTRVYVRRGDARRLS